jgi:hypothetical protein
MDNLSTAQPDAAAEAHDATAQSEGTEDVLIDEPQDVEPKPEAEEDTQPEEAAKTDTEDDTGNDDGEGNEDDDTESRNQRRRRLKREREAARTKELEAAKNRIQELEAKLASQAPKMEDFDTEAEYAAELAVFKAGQRLDTDAKTQAESQIKALTDEAEQEWQERAAEMRDAARQKYTDFDDKVRLAFDIAQANPNEAVEAAVRSEAGADIAYWLGNNPQEAREIMSLSPYEAAMQLGRITAQLPKAEPKKTTTAPPPITPVAPKATTRLSLDEIDDMDEYAKRRGFNL